MEGKSNKINETVQVLSHKSSKKTISLEKGSTSDLSDPNRSSEKNNFEKKETTSNEKSHRQISEKQERNQRPPADKIQIPNLNEFMANENQGRSIHSKFLSLKKQLNLSHFMRKTQIDSLLKKCKTKVFRIIHEALQKCLNTKPGRLPQLFITNIKIEYNKQYLAKTILEIYQEFNVLGSLDDLESKGYVITSRKKILEDFLNMTFKQAYENYIHSNQFKKDYAQICEKEGQQFAILFSYIAQIFIQYYQKSTGNKRKERLNHLEDRESFGSDDSEIHEKGFDKQSIKEETEFKEDHKSSI